MFSIGVLGGPKIDRLLDRDAKHYGSRSIEQIEIDIRKSIVRRGLDGSVQVKFMATDQEDEFVDALAKWDVDAWILNPASWTHENQRIAAAVAKLKKPFVEVHLSNVFAREELRRTSLTAPYAQAFISGWQGHGYQMAVNGLIAKHAL
jgi:3-dehydroquinate dehydratase-2